jgi:hypothetical protein
MAGFDGDLEDMLIPGVVGAMILAVVLLVYMGLK